MVFNKKNINFNKAKKKKARVKRKALNLEQKHKAIKKQVSGARTKKSLRKQAHKERVADKVQALTLARDEQMMDVSRSRLKRKGAKKGKGTLVAAAGTVPAIGEEMHE